MLVGDEGVGAEVGMRGAWLLFGGPEERGWRVERG